MKIAIVGGMKKLVEDYTKLAQQQGFEVTNKIYDKWDLLHLIYPLSKQGIQEFLNTNGGEKVLLHFQGDDTRPRNALHYWLLKRLIGMGAATAYTTPDLKYNLDWLAPKLKSYYLPVPIDTKKFNYKKSTARKNAYLIAGELYKLKHWEKRFEQLKESEVYAIDWGVDRDYYKWVAPNNITFIDKQKPESMPILYRSFKWIVPQASEAFEMFESLGRVELEALACGCKLSAYEHLDRRYVIKHHSEKQIGNTLRKIYNEV